MPKPMSGQRSMQLMRREGWTVGKVERWLAHAGGFGVRQDLFGFIDIVCMKRGFNGLLAIQTTTLTQFRSHIKKIISIPESLLWLQVGNSIEVHGWYKSGRFWRVKREPVDVGTIKESNLPEKTELS